VRLQLIAAALVVAAAPAPAHAERPPVELGFDTLLYTDDDNVIVSSTRVGASAKLDDDGSEVHAAAIADAVTAASVDVITEATPRFSELRKEADLGGAWALGRWLPSAHYRLSDEPDYVSNGGGLRLDRRIGDDATIEAGYDLTYDLVRRSGTSPDVFERTLTTHSADVSLSQVVDPNMVLRVAYSFVGQDGYMAKPYRYVPLFDPATIAAARAAGTAIGLDDFGMLRLPERPPENVPDVRLRHAIAGRVLRYLPSIGASVRGDYRLYLDDWGMRSHTGEAALRFAFDDRELGIAERVYEQTAADFWRRTYEVMPGTMPVYRSVDRELSHYASETTTLDVTSRHDRWTWYATASVMYTRYFDFLFLDGRLAILAGGGIKVDL
jgi:Protein of unknown function (DUF3570)